MSSVGDSIISWRFAAQALAWGATMAGVLQVRHLSGSWSHAICGPWGCGPPLEAVVTCHLVWILLLAPLVLAIISRLTPDAVRLCGWIAAGAGIAGLVAIAVWVAAIWLPQASSLQRPYFCQKYAYTITCLVDLPVVQVTLFGGLLLAIARRSRRMAREEAATVLEYPASELQTSIDAEGS